MSKQDNLTDFLTDLATHIKTKAGITGTLNPQDFSTTIDNIPTGGETFVKDITGSNARTIDLTSLTDDAVYHGHKKVTATTNEAVGFYVIKQGNNIAYIVENWLGNYAIYFKTDGIIDSRSGYFTFVGDYELYKVTDTDY